MNNKLELPSHRLCKFHTNGVGVYMSKSSVLVHCCCYPSAVHSCSHCHGRATMIDGLHCCIVRRWLWRKGSDSLTCSLSVMMTYSSSSICDLLLSTSPASSSCILPLALLPSQPILVFFFFSLLPPSFLGQHATLWPISCHCCSWTSWRQAITNSRRLSTCVWTRLAMKSHTVHVCVPFRTSF